MNSNLIEKKPPTNPMIPMSKLHGQNKIPTNNMGLQSNDQKKIVEISKLLCCFSNEPIFESNGIIISNDSISVNAGQHDTHTINIEEIYRLVSDCYNGKSSYNESLNNFLKIGMGKSSFHNIEKKNCLTKVFDLVLHVTTFINRKDKFINNINIDPKLKNDSPQILNHYFNLFSLLNFESSTIKTTISEINSDGIQISIENKINKNQKSFIPFKDIRSNLPENKPEKLYGLFLLYSKIYYGKDININEILKNKDIEALHGNIIEKFECAFNKIMRVKVLVLSGGGAKGLFFAGLLYAIPPKALKDMEQVMGASAGAISAGFLALGMEGWDFFERMQKTDAKFDRDFLISNANNTINDFLGNFFSNQKNMKIFSDKLKEPDCKFNKPEYKTFRGRILACSIHRGEFDFKLTLNDLHLLKEIFPDHGFKDVFLTSTIKDKDTGEFKEICFNYKDFPDVLLSNAMIASAAIPLPFGQGIEAVKIFDKKNGNEIECMDGGILNNLPFNYLNYLPGRDLKKSFNFNDMLVINFGENKELLSKYEQKNKLPLSASVKNKFAPGDTKPYARRLAHLIIAEKLFKNNMFYINTGKISTTDSEKGKKTFIQINENSQNQFTNWLLDEVNLLENIYNKQELNKLELALLSENTVLPKALNDAVENITNIFLKELEKPSGMTEEELMKTIEQILVSVLELDENK